jgi:hypothetical protein
MASENSEIKNKTVLIDRIWYVTRDITEIKSAFCAICETGTMFCECHRQKFHQARNETSIEDLQLELSTLNQKKKSQHLINQIWSAQWRLSTCVPALHCVPCNTSAAFCNCNYKRFCQTMSEKPIEELQSELVLLQKQVQKQSHIQLSGVCIDVPNSHLAV